MLVIARSAVFVWWEQAGFDSDQAIFGLMAKHITEGRAFPMFIYGDRYMLAVQAWLAAPLFAVFGPSVGVLKAPVVLVNVATGVLLVWVLHRDGGLDPVTALLASLFYVIAPPGLTASLVETGGGNPEPLLYVLLLWVLRKRPLALGLVFSFGFLQREFTLYGLVAIVAIALLDDHRITRERIRSAALAVVGYLIVWQAVRTFFVFSTPFGPGSQVTTPLGLGASFQAAANRSCWEPSAVVPGLASFFGDYLGIMFGADSHALVAFGMRSSLRTTIPGLPAFWPVMGIVLAAALARALWISVRDKKPVWRGPAAVGAFLFLVGLQSSVAYTLARCGDLQIQTSRYVLLSTYLGIGALALFFILETELRWRRLMMALVAVWAVISVTNHGRLLTEYLYHQPANPRRELATYLVTNGIRYARSDYWTAYSTTFLARERVVVASTDRVRISDYQDRVDGHRAQAVTVQSKACSGAGGAEAVAGMYWVCPD